MKKYFHYVVMPVLAAGMMLSLSWNVMAYKNSQGEADAAIPFVTSKSDRTLIKEILLQQTEAIALLREIVGMLEEKQ